MTFTEQNPFSRVLMVTYQVPLDNHLIQRNKSALENKETFPILCKSVIYEDLSTNCIVLAGTEAAFKNLFQLQRTLGIHQLIGLHPLKQLLFEGYAVVEEFGEEAQTSSTAKKNSTPNELLDEFLVSLTKSSRSFY